MATACRFLNVNADHEKLVDGLTLMLHSLLSEIIEFLLPSLLPPLNSKRTQNEDPTVIQLRAFSLTAAVLLQSYELSSHVTSWVRLGSEGSGRATESLFTPGQRANYHG